jgi:hypothetical protein
MWNIAVFRKTSAYVEFHATFQQSRPTSHSERCFSTCEKYLRRLAVFRQLKNVEARRAILHCFNSFAIPKHRNVLEFHYSLSKVNVRASLGQNTAHSCRAFSPAMGQVHTDSWDCLLLSRQTVKWLRRLVAGLSPRRPGFLPGSVHVGFVVDRVALWWGFLRFLRV